MGDADPYRVLGVNKDSSDSEIQRAYRKKSRQYHPDRNQGDKAAEVKFKEVQSAYESIGTEQARREYDQKKQMENMFGGGNPFGRGNPFGQSNPFGQGGMGGLDDMISQMFGGGGMPRQAPPFQQRQRQSSPEPEKGKDLQVSLDLTLEQATEGGKFPFSVRRIRFENGTQETKKVTMKLNLEPGIEHGSNKKLKGQGHAHPRGTNGDLIVKIRIDPGSGRRWEDGKLVQDVPVPYSTLMLGGKVQITTPNGKSGNLSVAKNSLPGERRRMGQAGYNDGDLELEFVLQEIESLTKKQLDLIQKLKETGL